MAKKSKITVTATNSKVNINSVDNSVNIHNKSNVFAKLKEAFTSVEDNRVILNSIEEMEKNVGNSSFKDKYAIFIATVANHMTIVAPFIPALTAML